MIRLLLTFFRGLQDMLRHPLINFFTLFTVTMVVLLAGIFLIFLDNVNKELMVSRGQAEFQIYWQTDAEQAEIDKQWQQLSNIQELKSIQTFSPQQALEELTRKLQTKEDSAETFLWAKGHSPLPASAYLSFYLKPGEEGKIWTQALLNELEKLPWVESVHYNPFQMELAQSWITLVNGIIWPVIGMLWLVIALVVSNTMRLSLLTRSDEIEILSLVGARTWYIRGPLLMAGAVQGFLGSALALGILKLAQASFKDVLNFPPLYLVIDYLPQEHWLALMAMAIFIAMLSSFVAVRR